MEENDDFQRRSCSGYNGRAVYERNGFFLFYKDWGSNQEKMRTNTHHKYFFSVVLLKTKTLINLRIRYIHVSFLHSYLFATLL
jgi:hypothetical protein